MKRIMKLKLPSYLLFYAIFISMLLVHTIDASAQQQFLPEPENITTTAKLLDQIGSCPRYNRYDASQLTDCLDTGYSLCDDDGEDCGSVVIDFDTCKATFSYRSQDAFDNWVTKPDKRISINDCRSETTPSSCDDYQQTTGFCYANTGYGGAQECGYDPNCDGGYEAADEIACPNGGIVYPGQGCNDEDQIFYCDSGEIVLGGIAACDTTEPGDGIGFDCYDGSFAISASDCPEFNGDTSNPEAEPNGVCEGNNYSFDSTDPDCNAPTPSPCPSNTVCDADSTDPNSDHDGDGVSNSSDADADSDGDGIPNGIDTDADGDGIPNHQDSDYTGFTGQGGTWVDSDGDGFHDDYQDGEGEEEAGDPTTGDSSGTCDAPPQCSDGSVECAILKQEWTSMCYDGVDANASNSCGQQPTCDGDKAQCAILLQQFYTACEFPEFDTSGEQEQPGSFMDSEGFYDSAYPDGVSGIWESKRAELENTEILGWLNSFQFADGGQCPVWTFELWLVGSISTPTTFCYLFDIVRAIFILSSMFYARRIVFGG